mmetsp:Transcript_49745/g.56286  ORF Transcript_49745/g.56286 Transcript_49745/m.56286 type:complete len:93 (-) Transcript_49745:107-385(-)
MRTTNKEKIDARVLGATITMTMLTTTTKNKELGATIMTNKERLTQMDNPSSDFMKNVTMIRNVYLRQQMVQVKGVNTNLMIVSDTGDISKLC